MLNAQTLRDSIAPTLSALENFGIAESIALQREPRATISSISQDSPVSINLTGLKDAVQLVLEYAIPWRREHAKRLSELEVRRCECDIEKIEQDNSFHGLEHQRKRLELAKLEFELTRSKWEMAEQMLKSFDRDHQLQGEARHQAMQRVLMGLDQLASTRLEFEIVLEGERPMGSPRNRQH